MKAGRIPHQGGAEQSGVSATDGAAALSESGGLDRAERAAKRFTVPVILAALASVPAMFLTALDGTAAVVGDAVNYATLAVFAAESAVLFALAGDRRRWLADNKLLVGFVALTIPAVIFAVGPVQLLRLVRFVGALRVLRVRRILRAGKVLRTRAGLTGPVWTAVVALATVLAAVFVALVLADPTSYTRQFVDTALGRFGPVPIALAGLLLAAATVIVWRGRRDEPTEGASADGASADGAGSTDRRSFDAPLMRERL